MWLVKRYLDHLCSEKPSPPTEVARCSVNRNKRTLFGSRAAFLDFLPPFDVAGGVFDVCKLSVPPAVQAAGKETASSQQPPNPSKKEKVKSMMSKMLTMARSRDSDAEDEGGDTGDGSGPGNFLDHAEEKNAPCPCSLCNGQLLGLQVRRDQRLPDCPCSHHSVSRVPAVVALESPGGRGREERCEGSGPGHPGKSRKDQSNDQLF